MKQGTLIETSYQEASDLQLRSDALNGNTKALDQLIRNHYAFIYNVALKMVLDPNDAEDVTQEIVIKIITHLGKFQGRSSFRTWLYRIVVNHILTLKKMHCEYIVQDFDQYARELNQMPDHDFPFQDSETPESQQILEEIKLSCTAGMLMCLDREQRLVYTLGGIFEVDHNLGAEILDITPANFRQKLSRARKQLHSFMHNQCSLVNPSNPCKCAKKTKAFIDSGVVDPNHLVYRSHFTRRIEQILEKDHHKMEKELDTMTQSLYQNAPYQESEAFKKKLLDLIDSKRFQDTLDFGRES
ncbi:RNA polymerase sigma factor [bacterium SCSIO 12741]|nr:RNA polymerase sigma factor [bacterium SCSIO 12741]